MSRLLWGLILAGILISSAAPAHEGRPFCATPLFHEYKMALNQAFDRSRHRLGEPVVRSTPEVGDTMSFWTWDLSQMPPPWIQVPATCRAVGEYCYVFVADDQWNVNMDSADVDSVVLKFDSSTPADPTRGIYEIDTEVFGPAPDELDGDPTIYIFYSALGCFMGTCFDGYFSDFNQYTEEEAQQMGGHSNEVEMFYMSCDPIDPTAESTLAVLAHEFEHMIHWNMDRNEAIWVDEGCAEYAMFLYGHPDPITGFPTYPNNNLIVWGQDWEDYIQTYLFMMYLTDKFGGDSTMTTLVADTADGIDGVESTLSARGYSETFEEVFVDWTIANFLDDASIYDGQYGYDRIDLPAFRAFRHDTYPVAPETAYVEHWAAMYRRFVEGSPMTLFYDGSDNSTFSVPLLRLDGEIPTTVEYTVLDGLEDGEFPIPYFGVGFDTLIMVSAHPTSVGDKAYSYWTEDMTDVAAHFPPASQLRAVTLLPNRPNPFHPVTTITFGLPERQEVRLGIYDVMGRLVREIADGEWDAGYTALTWDGRDRRGVPVPPGVYFSRLETKGTALSRKIVLTR